MFRSPHEVQDVGFLNGLLEVIVGAFPHGFDGVPDIAMCGDDQHEDRRVIGSQLTQNVETRHARHHDIEQDELNRRRVIRATLANDA